ncbi:hypothetical protein ACLQ26_31330 [Micromonospora sp. DT43]|uniref:hypothetical protein n=1 Tax=Micromonospora sp. DT43 TaxID=3393440 RepID=UPI003CEEB580
MFEAEVSQVRDIGHFNDLPHGQPTEMGLREASGKLTVELVGPVVGYLTGGSVLAASAGYAYDELDAERPEIAPLSILTDGEWSWPSDLPYYVERYRVGLPQEFLRHAEALGWRPPRLTRQQLEELEQLLFGQQ